MEGEEPAQQKGAAVERLRAAWSRRKWLAVLVFALPLVAAVTAIFALPDLYRSTALVLVERQQVPEAFVASTVTSELETRLHTISQEILSRSRLEGARSPRFGLYPGPARARIERRSRRADAQGHPPGAEDHRHQGSAERHDRLRALLPGAATRRRSRWSPTRSPPSISRRTSSFASARPRAPPTSSRCSSPRQRKRLDELEARVSEFRKRYLGELPQQMQANLTTLENLNIAAPSEQRQPDPRRRAARLPHRPARRGRLVPAGVRRLARTHRRRAPRAAPRPAPPGAGERAHPLHGAAPHGGPAQGGDRRHRAGARRALRRAGQTRPAVASSPYVMRLRETLSSRRVRSQDPESRGAAPPRRHRRLPSQSREHAQARAGVPGGLPGLRDDEAALRVAGKAARGGAARREHGAAAEGRAVPDPGPGRPLRRSRPRRTASSCSS